MSAKKKSQKIKGRRRTQPLGRGLMLLLLLRSAMRPARSNPVLPSKRSRVVRARLITLTQKSRPGARQRQSRAQATNRGPSAARLLLGSDVAHLLVLPYGDNTFNGKRMFHSERCQDAGEVE